MAGEFEILYDFTGFERALGELIQKLEHREPLMRQFAGAMQDAVEENFARQGRPAWLGWSPRYAKKRAGGRILQLSGRLASSVVSLADNDSATVGTNVIYAVFTRKGEKSAFPRGASAPIIIRARRANCPATVLSKRAGLITANGIRSPLTRSPSPPAPFCI